jgi:DNA-binding CsgD family transcriptional regulator
VPVTLTPTERRVLDCILAGQVTKEIAKTLVISPRTAQFHASNLYAKHGVATREELLRLKRSGGSRFEWNKLSDHQKRICTLSVLNSQPVVASIMGISLSAVVWQLRVCCGILQVKGVKGLAAYMGSHGLLSSEAEVIEMHKPQEVRKSA